MDKITEWLGGGKGEDDSKEFTGLFIFEFDGEGRVVSHTIEHVQVGGNWEKGVGARVVGLTDWLLGGLRNGRGDGTPCPAFWYLVVPSQGRPAPPSHLTNFREAKLARRSGPYQTSLIDFERSEAGSLGLPP